MPELRALRGAALTFSEGEVASARCLVLISYSFLGNLERGRFGLSILLAYDPSRQTKTIFSSQIVLCGGGGLVCTRNWLK
jgi:hypothetical protein